MIQFWLTSDDWIIIGALIILFAGNALLLHYLCFRPANRTFVMGFIGVVGPFFVVAATIFALTTALLGGTVWQNFRDNSQAINTESQAITMFIELNNATPEFAEYHLVEIAKKYIDNAIEEWASIQHQKQSPKADAQMLKLLATTIRAINHTAISPAIADALMKSVNSIALARASRLNSVQSKTDPARWTCVILLALLTQVAVASVHLEKSKPMALALFITTATIIVALGLIALTDSPLLGAVSVSIDPLKQILLR